MEEYDRLMRQVLGPPRPKPRARKWHPCVCPGGCLLGMAPTVKKARESEALHARHCKAAV